jgi:branched-chain amino acid transport system ATP-binding protein
MDIVQIKNIDIRFGGLTALDNFSLRLPEGAIFGLIGPNGAGKTTAFNLISGFLKPTAGKIIFQEKDITDLPAHAITQCGMARTFQNIRLFKDMNVLDNILAACQCRARAGFWENISRLPRFLREEKAFYTRALGLLEEVGLLHKAHEKAGQLPYGQQRHLEIARALATKPQLLLLDEPAAGLNPQETLALMGFIKEIHQRYLLTILLIEHNMKFIMGICEHLTVLDHGLIIACGTPQEIQTSPQVIQAYLGEAPGA